MTLRTRSMNLGNGVKGVYNLLYVIVDEASSITFHLFYYVEVSDGLRIISKSLITNINFSVIHKSHVINNE